DGRAAALVSDEGSIDWMCVPRFDSAPVFSRLVDSSGGCFLISPPAGRPTARRYLDGSAVLETTWQTQGAEVRLREGMVLDVSTKLMPQLVLVREVSSREAPASIRVWFDPRRGFPSIAPETSGRVGVVRSRWGGLVLTLRTQPSLEVVPGQECWVDVEPGTPLTLVLSLADREPALDIDPRTAIEALESTDRWWRSWSEEISFDGSFRDPVVRSLIMLRLLTYPPS